MPLEALNATENFPCRERSCTSHGYLWINQDVMHGLQKSIDVYSIGGTCCRSTWLNSGKQCLISPDLEVIEVLLGEHSPPKKSEGHSTSL